MVHRHSEQRGLRRGRKNLLLCATVGGEDICAEREDASFSICCNGRPPQRAALPTPHPAGVWPSRLGSPRLAAPRDKLAWRWEDRCLVREAAARVCCLASRRAASACLAPSAV